MGGTTDSATGRVNSAGLQRSWSLLNMQGPPVPVCEPHSTTFACTARVLTWQTPVTCNRAIRDVSLRGIIPATWKVPQLTFDLASTCPLDWSERVRGSLSGAANSRHSSQLCTGRLTPAGARGGGGESSKRLDVTSRSFCGCCIAAPLSCVGNGSKERPERPAAGLGARGLDNSDGRGGKVRNAPRK